MALCILILFIFPLLLSVHFHIAVITKIPILPSGVSLRVIVHNTLLSYDWSSLYNESSVDYAVDMLNATLMKSVNLAVPVGRVSKHKYPAWFSSRLKTY
jgi:hypothetical protein